MRHGRGFLAVTKRHMLFADTSTALLCGRRNQKWHLHDQGMKIAADAEAAHKQEHPQGTHLQNVYLRLLLLACCNS